MIIPLSRLSQPGTPGKIQALILGQFVSAWASVELLRFLQVADLKDLTCNVKLAEHCLLRESPEDYIKWLKF